MVRQLSKVSEDQWNEEFNPDNIVASDKLDILVSSFDSELRRVYDKLAPQKKCKVNLRNKVPWYDEEIKTFKRKVCKFDKKWLKYKLESLWKAYMKLINSYFGLLNAKKKSTLQTKIDNCGNDSRSLHALVNSLTCKQMEQKWQNHTSDDQLAEEFVSHFQGKIEKKETLLKISLCTSPLLKTYQCWQDLPTHGESGQ